MPIEYTPFTARALFCSAGKSTTRPVLRLYWNNGRVASQRGIRPQRIRFDRTSRRGGPVCVQFM